MRALTLLFCLAVPVLAQGLDEQIQSEYQSLMELLDPGDAQQVDEDAARRRAERFQEGLRGFNDRWLLRATEIGASRFILGRALAQQGRLEEAITQLNGFLASYPTHQDAEQAQITVGTAYLDLGDTTRAETTLRAFLTAHPKSEQRGVVLFYLSLVKSEMGAWTEAVALLREALAAGVQPPLDADARLKLVDFLRDGGQYDAARTELAALLKENPDAAYLQTLKEQLDWLGKPAPELVKVATWLNGAPESLTQHRGQVVVLNFFAHFYEACRTELASLSEYARSESTRSDLVFLGLTKFYTPKDKVSHADQVEIVRTVLKGANVQFPVGIADDEFANLKAYGVRGVPWTVVIDREGNIAYIGFGARRNQTGASKELKAAVTRALSPR